MGDHPKEDTLNNEEVNHQGPAQGQKAQARQQPQRELLKAAAPQQRTSPLRGHHATANAPREKRAGGNGCG